MAPIKQLPADLTLDLGGDFSPEEFVSAVRNFFGYVSEITEAQQGDGSDVSWVVRVKEGSALIGLIPNDTAPRSRISMIYRQARHGVQSLTDGSVARSGLSEKATSHLKILSDLSKKHGSDSTMNLWIGEVAVPMSGAIAKNLNENIETDYFDLGTLEGRLEAIQDFNGSLRIRIKDFLYPRAINCVVPERLIQHVLDSFRRRVEVEGRIHYRANGTPISIEAESIEILPEDDDLPSAADVRGILATA